jgi:DNA replicative helicase MCM subunit Mcm2 (Cdc46/Mcm family)
VTWGCEAKASITVPTWTDEVDKAKYDRCPMTMIPDSVHQFMRVRRYHEQFPGAAMPAFVDCAVRFRLANGYYEGKVSEYARYMKQGK